MIGSAAGSETRPLHSLWAYDCSTFSSYSVYSSGEKPSVLGDARPSGPPPCRRLFSIFDLPPLHDI